MTVSNSAYMKGFYEDTKALGGFVAQTPQKQVTSRYE